jgi:hypothetical protein
MNTGHKNNDNAVPNNTTQRTIQPGDNSLDKKEEILNEIEQMKQILQNTSEEIAIVRTQTETVQEIVTITRVTQIKRYILETLENDVSESNSDK